MNQLGSGSTGTRLNGCASPPEEARPAREIRRRASLDRINRAKEHWRAYVQGRAELELMLNKQAILLSAWRAEDRALRSSMARPVVCRDCGARELEHFYTSKRSSTMLCTACFQQRVERDM